MSSKKSKDEAAKMIEDAVAKAAKNKKVSDQAKLSSAKAADAARKKLGTD